MATLGGVGVVGVKWWPAEKPAPTAARPAAVSAPVPTETATASTPESPTKSQTMTWSQIVAAIESDPRMSTKEINFGSRDPFAVTAPKTTTPDKETTRQAAPKTVVTPESQGLSLVSTAIGPNRRAAIITDKVYAEGDEVRAADGAVYRLERVEPREITLTADGRRYTLKIKPTERQERNDGIVITRGGDRTN